MKMIFNCALFIVAMLNKFVHASYVNTDLAHGLVHNSSKIIGSGPIDYGSFSDFPEDCAAVYIDAKKMSNMLVTSGIYEIWPRQGTAFFSSILFITFFVGKPFVAFCDMETDGDGWTVFQKRDDLIPVENFYRTWLEYKRGFGDLQKQFWFGNDRLSLLTNQDAYELRVDLEDFDGQQGFAHYYSFRIGNELNKYQLTVGRYIDGNAGDSLGQLNGRQFSTKDFDNDEK